MTQDYDEAVVISERRILSVKSKVLIGILLAGIGVGLAWYGWLAYSSGKTYPVENFGVTAEPLLDAKATGYIYLSGFAENVGFNTFALNLNTQMLEPVTTNGNGWEYSSMDESHALFSSSLNKSTEENTQIVVTDFSENSYLNVKTPEGYYKRNLDAFVMEKDAIVYSARTAPVTEGEDFFDAAKWTVVYGEPETNQFTVIDNAFAPVLLQERNEIMYVKTDGVYVHNYFTKETYQVNTGLGNFFAGTEMALSPERSHVVMTLPLNKSIVVLAVTAEDVITMNQIGVIKDEVKRYATPVISPDGNFYAVLAAHDESETETDTVEIRALQSRETIAQFPVSIVDDNTARLHEWGTDMIITTAKSHHDDESDHSHNN